MRFLSLLVCDKLGLLQKCPEVGLGYDVFVFDVIFKLPLFLLREGG